MEETQAIGTDLEASQVLDALPIGVAWTSNQHVRSNARWRQKLGLLTSILPLDEFLQMFELREIAAEQDETPPLESRARELAPRRVLLITRDGEQLGAVVSIIHTALATGGQGAVVVCEEIPASKEEGRGKPLLAALEHEIRGTLQTFSLTISSVLRVADAITEQQRDLLQRNLRVLNRTIHDLLDAVSIGEGTIHFRPVKIQIAEFVRQLVEMHSKTDGQHRFTWSAPVDLEVLADPDRLQQIVINLLTNAVKYSTSGALELGARVDSNRVLLWIKDEGPGISEKDQEVLFHPYSRLASAREGSGLGLWIARELARGMGGDLWLNSSQGRNSIFYLALPM
jgi:signal transduction histidine kinase